MAVLGTAAAAYSFAQAPATFRISGMVVDAVRGEALNDIEVTIRLSQSETLLQSVVTGPDGRFEFSGLAPAKYALFGRGHGYLDQAYEQHRRFSTAIVTGTGFKSENLIFRLKPDASISVTVTDEFGDPVPLAEVLLFASSQDLAQAVFLKLKQEANDEGYFKFIHLQEGKYYLAVTAHPWYARNESEDKEEKTTLDPDSKEELPEPQSSSVHRHSDLDLAFQTRYYVNSTEPELANPIILKPGDRLTVDLRLFAAPAVRLKIRGTPASNVGQLVLWERIFSYSRRVVSQELDQDGAEFESLAPGRYLLEFPAPSPDALPQQRPLDLVADTELVPGENSKSVSTVTGTIQAEGNANPCMRCRVQFVSLPSGEPFVVQNTPKGFEVEGGLRPGSYAVAVPNPEKYLIKDLSAVGAKIVGRQIEMKSGAKVRLSIVVTKDAGRIDGVVLREGKPVSQSAVFLVPNDSAHNLALFKGDQSDSDGTFSLPLILPGEYTVVAIAEGWDLEWTNADELRPYLGGGVKVRIQAGSKNHIEVAEQPLKNTPK
jgi:hypothetical protein